MIVNAPRVFEVGEVPADARLPTGIGEFRIRVFNEEETGLDHVALLLGDMGGPTAGRGWQRVKAIISSKLR